MEQFGEKLDMVEGHGVLYQLKEEEDGHGEEGLLDLGHESEGEGAAGCPGWLLDL